MCLGRIGVITEVWESGGVPLALIGTGPTAETVCLLGCPAAGPGTQVLVHAGFVVEVLGPDAAAEARRLRAGAVPGGEWPADGKGRVSEEDP